MFKSKKRYRYFLIGICFLVVPSFLIRGSDSGDSQRSEALSSTPVSSVSHDGLSSYSSPASGPDLPVVIHSNKNMLGCKRSRESAEAEQTGPVCIDLIPAIVAVYNVETIAAVPGISIRAIASKCFVLSRNEASRISFVFRMPESYKGPKTNLLIEYTDGSSATMTPAGNESEYVYKTLSKKD